MPCPYCRDSHGKHAGVENCPSVMFQTIKNYDPANGRHGAGGHRRIRYNRRGQAMCALCDRRPRVYRSYCANCQRKKGREHEQAGRRKSRLRYG